MRPLASLGEGDLLGIAMPSPFYPSSIVFFQLHGGMVSLMQSLATPSSTIPHNSKYFDTYHENISVLVASS